jgi:hypothetical protein
MANANTGATWVTRLHPQRNGIVNDQLTERASYIATRDILISYLVPHRFEGKSAKPQDLIRAQYGYGLGLNKSYLQDIMGHIRGAPTLWNWGAMEEGGTDEEGNEVSTPTAGDPAGGLALTLWEDATRDNVTWRNFFMRKVLEWMLSSPGGFVLVDNPRLPEGDETPTMEQAEQLALRPYTQFLSWAQVEDWGRYELGYKWIKIVTEEDNREPMSDMVQSDQRVRVLYELNDEGETEVSRWEVNGNQIGETVNVGKILDRQGQVTLPFVPVAYGEREGLEYVGQGLIADLADIIIDLFNTFSETREGFRDATFGIFAYSGDRGDNVQALLDEGTRFVDLGDNENASLQRIAGNVEEVTQGLALMDFSLKAWDAAARSNAATAQARARTMSGIALQAEFQLDLAPLLKEVAETLDQIESDTMFLCGQFGGFEPTDIEDVGVMRSTEFRPEEEAGRIARIIKDFNQTGIPVPAEAQLAALMAWTSSLDFLDLDGIVEGIEGVTTRRDLIRLQAAQAIQEEETRRRNESAFLLGAPTDEEPDGEELPEI